MPAQADPLAALADLLRCPITGARLARVGDELKTPDDAMRYQVVGGIPVLIDPSLSVFGASNIAGGSTTTAGRRGFVSRLSGLLPSPTLNVAAKANYERLAGLIDEQCEGAARVLVVGGAIEGHGFAALKRLERLQLVETDVVVGPRTRIVCDAHHLPFADGVFDAVICQAVLEHVLEPAAVVAEMHRVLKPAGLVYTEIPFMQQVHAGPYDFTRYTLSGHRRLMRMFTEIDSGAACGPATAMVWSIAHFARTLGGRSRTVRELLGAMATCLTFWIKYLDRALVVRPAALDAASATYFIGRRADVAIGDRAVIDGYRGGGRATSL